MNKILSLLILLTMFLVACDSKDKNFIEGTWETDKGYKLEFGKDNKAVSSSGDGKESADYTYQIKKPKSDNLIIVREKNKYKQYEFTFKILGQNEIQMIKGKMYDKDGGLVSEGTYETEAERITYKRIK